MFAMLKVEIDREEDGRWLAEVPDLPGVTASGKTEAEARTRVAALAFRVIAERLEQDEPAPIDTRDFFITA
jgi:predicted RNase H-like HicB family nuclease